MLSHAYNHTDLHICIHKNKLKIRKRVTEDDIPTQISGHTYLCTRILVYICAHVHTYIIAMIRLPRGCCRVAA